MSLVNKMHFNLLDHPISLQEPFYLTDISNWHHHIPFAFTLVQWLQPRIFVELGTFKGDSYCAFCQAVDYLRLPTSCFAVDTWKGDKQLGNYSEEIYQNLKEYHDPLYGSFSTLLRSLFDEAAHTFADNTIDLLHIDGLHTYEAVKHDFETWLPKMSERGVILFHDTNVRESYYLTRGYEVWRFWEEVSSRYPSFEFKYGHGLGVLAVGRQVPEKLLLLLEKNTETQKTLVEYFFALGNRIFNLAQHRAVDEVLRKQLAVSEQDRVSLRENLQSVEQDRNAIRQNCAAIKNYLELVETDREALKKYIGVVEADRENLIKFYQQSINDLKALQQTRSVKWSRRIGAIVRNLRQKY